MTEEIKEILDKLKIKNDRYSHHLKYNTSYENKDEDYEAHSLLNYITNLQKENQILKENAEHNDKVVDKAKWNEMIYKSRNEKAVEYIKKHSFISKDTGTRIVTMNVKEDEVLLNILKGGDE